MELQLPTKQTEASLTISPFCALLILSTCCLPNLAEGSEKIACPTPTFEDKFNQGNVDTTKWYVLNARKPDDTAPRTGLQNYSADAVRTGPDGLQIALSEKPGPEYWSGRIVTKQTFLYGRIEIQAKLPVGRGLWPALWMRTPTNVPLNGEIDLVEGFGSDPSSIQSTLHPWVDGKEDRRYCAILSVRKTSNIRRSACSLVAKKFQLTADLSKAFHTYAVDWAPDRIVWSFDGVPYFAVNKEIPKSPMAIFINLAISPLHDGDPDKSLKLPEVLSVKKVQVCGRAG